MPKTTSLARTGQQQEGLNVTFLAEPVDQKQVHSDEPKHEHRECHERRSVGGTPIQSPVHQRVASTCRSTPITAGKRKGRRLFRLGAYAPAGDRRSHSIWETTG